MSSGVSPDSVRIEPHQPQAELPKASHLHLTVKPAWKTLLSPVLPYVYPRARAKAQLFFPALLAVDLGFLLPPIAGTQISCSRLEVFHCEVTWKLETNPSQHPCSPGPTGLGGRWDGVCWCLWSEGPEESLGTRGIWLSSYPRSPGPTNTGTEA